MTSLHGYTTQWMARRHDQSLGLLLVDLLIISRPACDYERPRRCPPPMGCRWCPSSGAPRFLAFPNYHTKQLMLFDLLAEAAVGIPVAQIEQNLITAAVSANGDSLCLGDSRGGLWVYDQAALVAAAHAGAAGEPTGLVPHRARNAQPLGGYVSSAAFSDDGDLLYATCVHGAITVHDARHESLPVLRALPFVAPSDYVLNYRSACAGGLLAAVGDEAGGSSHSHDTATAPHAAFDKVARDFIAHRVPHRVDP